MLFDWINILGDVLAGTVLAIILAASNLLIKFLNRTLQQITWSKKKMFYKAIFK